MKKSLLIILCLTLLLTASVQAAPANQTDSLVTVTGHAEMAVVPDTAFVSVGIVTTGADVATAKRNNDAVMSTILAEVLSLGIDKDQVRTAGFTIQPQYKQTAKYDDYQTITSYQVQNVVSIAIRDFALISPVIDRCTQAGANQIHSLRFAVQDESKIKAQLLEQAVRDGKAKAATIANALDMSLGKPVSVQVSSYSNHGSYDTMSVNKGLSSSTPINAGTVSLSADVNIVFLMQ